MVVGWINQVCWIPVEWTIYPCEIQGKCSASGPLTPALDSLSENELRHSHSPVHSPRTLVAETRMTPISVSRKTETPRTRPFSMGTASVRYFFFQKNQNLLTI